MYTWFQELLKKWKNITDTNIPEETRPSAPVKPSHQSQARTKSIYPRQRGDEERERQFRFPVIPDQSTKQAPHAHQAPKRENAKHEKPKQAEEDDTTIHTIRRERKPATSRPSAPKDTFEKKRSFKPTEIISPIYGKIDPDKEVPKQPVAETGSVSAPTRFAPFPSAHVSMTRQGYKEGKAENVDNAMIAVEEEVPTMEIGTSPVEEPPVEEPPVEEPPAEEPPVEEPAKLVPIPFTVLAQAYTEVAAATVTVEPPVEEPPVEEPPVEEPPVEEPELPAAQTVEPEPNSTYMLPDLSLLTPSPTTDEDDYEYTLEQKRLLEETLANFNVSAQVVNIVKGPTVTRFELQPAPGVKVNKITGLSDDIKLNMAAKDIRIEAPIPGRNAVGIEVPNLKSQAIFISRIIGSEKFKNHPSPLAIALGMDIGGEPIVADIKKMPHGLIAGSTGSGKSVCINSIIISLLYKATPEQVRLLLVDPKMVELAPYNHLPHLVTPVITEAKQATAALKWAVEQMEKRYTLFVDAGVRDIERYNQTTDEPLPYIVIIIDELADLMMVSPQDVEDCIIRIAQKARACGIHLLLATQRPSVDVITGNIKANVPTRLAFAVFSQIDSRTILDQSGAERLLGRGDMLFLESGAPPTRLQGNFVGDDEIESVTQMIKKQRKPEYFFSKEDLENQASSFDEGDDPLFYEALIYVAEQGQASSSGLQRRFRIGYNRAARLIEMMEGGGYVAGHAGGKPRTVLITLADAQALTEGTQ